MRIAVLVKQVPDTWGERRLDPATGRLDRAGSDRVVDEIGERAAEVALAARDALPGTEVVVVTMGPAPAADALRKVLSMGADSAVHVVDDGLAGADVLRTARALAAALRDLGADLVVAGNESTDGRGGVVPAMLAELVGVPALLNLDEVAVAAGEVSGIRATEDSTVALRAALPAIVSVTERVAEPRFPTLKGIMGAKRKPSSTVTLASLAGVGDGPSSIVLSAEERPPRTAGEILDDDPAAVARLADYLTSQRLA